MEELGAPASDPPSADAAPRARSRWWVWTSVIVATIIGATGFAIVDQPPPTGAGPSVVGLLPGDGAAWEVVDEQYGTFAVEASRFTGYAELFDLPDLVSLGIADAIMSAGAEVMDAHFYREIWTPVDGAGTEPVSTQITAVYWLADDGIRLASVSGGASGFVYDPMLLTVPESVEPGSTWASAGDALPQGILEYRSTGSAAAAENGCLEITIATDLTDPTAADADADAAAIVSSSLESAVWCRGEGAVASTSRINGLESSSTTRPVSGAAAGLAERTGVPAPAATDRWGASPRSLVSIDPLFGETEQFVVTSPIGATTASGVSVFVSGRDAVGLRVDDDRVVRRFIGHPGGDIVGVSAVGDLVLVATSERRLVAYDDRGARRWVADFGDVVIGDAVGAGADGLLVVALDGELRNLDAADGSTRWRLQLGGDVALAPLVTDVGVVIAGRDGTITMVDTASGGINWTASTESPMAMGAIGETVLILTDDGTLVALDATTGVREWIRTTDATASLAIVDGAAIVHGSTVIEAFSSDGVRLWRSEMPPSTTIDQIAAAGDATVVLTESTIAMVGGTGDIIVEAPLPAGTATSRHLLLPRSDGVLLVTGNGELLLFGPQP